MSTEKPPLLLFRALGANALFSFLSALVLFRRWQHHRQPNSACRRVLRWITSRSYLCLFAAQLGSIVVFRRLYVLEIALFIIADLAWVIFSGIGLVMYGAQMTDLGKWLVGGVALAVLAFAEVQGWGFFRWRKSGYVRA